MSWFNFLNKKTETTSENNAEDLITVHLVQKLGVFLHVGEGNSVLVLASFWDENLFLDEVRSDRKIVAILVLNGMKEGNLPLDKIFQIQQIDSKTPIYFATLENSDNSLKLFKKKQLPEKLDLGLACIYFQKGTHFVRVKFGATLHTKAANAYIGIHIQYAFQQDSKNTFRMDDTWFIGSFNFQNPGKTFDELMELALTGAYICIFQFRDWIKANREIHLIAFQKLGFECYSTGKNQDYEENT